MSRVVSCGYSASRDAFAAWRAVPWARPPSELANVLERATILASGLRLGPELLDLREPRRGSPPTPPKSTPELRSLDEVQREHIRGVLLATGGRIYGEKGAARILGLPPSTLQSRMQKLGIARRPATRDERSG